MIDFLLVWLKENAPYVYAGLNGPAEKSELERVQSVLSIEFPEAMQSFFLLHNGQRLDCGCGPYYGMIMLSLDQIESHWQSNLEVQRELESMGDMEQDPELQSASPDKVKLMSFNERWIPFAHDSAGNFLGLDFDPDTRGVKGQIINFGSDEFTKYVLGDSFDEFLSWYMGQLASGNYRISTEDYGDNEESIHRFDPGHPETTHFLDVLSHWF